MILLFIHTVPMKEQIESKFKTRGLPGFRVIREFLGLGIAQIALAVGLNRTHVHKIQAGACDCTLATLYKFEHLMCCTADDFLSEELPTPARLAEIRAAYLEREAARARAEADAAKKGQVA